MVFPGPKFTQLGHTELGLSSAGVREWQPGSARAGKSLHAEERKWLGQVTKLGLSSQRKLYR